MSLASMLTRIERIRSRLTLATTAKTGSAFIAGPHRIHRQQVQLPNASIRQSPRRAELIALRKDAANLRASIIDALAVQVGTEYDDVARLLLRPGVDADMLDCDQRLLQEAAAQLRPPDRAGRIAGDNARKPARDQCWNELLAIWCELGGKPRGKAAAEFLRLRPCR